jgi:hypothetical protein
MQKNKEQDKVEDLPIEEFENDNQDFREEFLKEFEDIKETSKKEKPIEKGGMSDSKSIKEIAEKHNVDIDDILKQLELGIKVEMEHTDDPKIAIEIAKDHLCEFPTYYTELDKMEQSLKDKEKAK